MARSDDRHRNGTYRLRNRRVRHPVRPLSASHRPGKEELLQALGLSFTISTLAYDKSGPRWCAQRFFFGGLLLLGAYLVIGAFR